MAFLHHHITQACTSTRCRVERDSCVAGAFKVNSLIQVFVLVALLIYKFLTHLKFSQINVLRIIFLGCVMPNFVKETIKSVLNFTVLSAFDQIIFP